MIYLYYVLIIIGVIIASELIMYLLFKISDKFYQIFDKNRERNMWILRIIQLVVSIYIGQVYLFK